MNCHSFINVLDLHREGRLSPRRAQAAEKHLASCAACRALGESSPASRSTPAPPALKAKLLAAAKAGSGAIAAGSHMTDLPLWPREARGIALAAAALLIAGLLVAAAGVPSQSTGGPVAAVEEP